MKSFAFVGRNIAQSACFLWMAISPSVEAHEFWFVPVVSPQPVGESVPLRLELNLSRSGSSSGKTCHE